jgi:hypothetical protein
MIPTYDNLVQELSGTKEWHELNKYRKKSIRERIIAWLIGFTLLLMGFALIIFGTDSDTISSGLGSLVMSVVMVVFLYRLTRKKYSLQFKRLLIPRLVTDIFENSSSTDDSGEQVARCKFNPEKHINMNLLVSIPLFRKYDADKIIYDGEDLFSGSLGKTDFQFSDFVIKRNRDLILVNQNVDVTVFRGLVFIADFNKSFEGTTTLTTRRGKIYKRQTVIGSRMRTVSHEFDQMFKVSTTDEITARYLLPANILERIIKLRKGFPRKGRFVSMTECWSFRFTKSIFLNPTA